jgi:hypothetical protein
MREVAFYEVWNQDIMKCPSCFSTSIILIAWAGRRLSIYGLANILILSRCEPGHSFQTMTIFEGADYREHYVPSDKTLSAIRLCWN